MYDNLSEVNNRGQTTLRQFLTELSLLLVLTTAVAGALSIFMATSPLRNLTFSLTIGLAIFLIAWGHVLIRRDHQKCPRTFAIAIPAGGSVGVIAGSYLIGSSPLQLLEQQPRVLLTAAIAAAVFGTAISYYFYARSRIAESGRQLQAETLNRARNEQRLTETELRMLQAQIEPHFLFNTLSNVLGLIDYNPASAKRMLENLTHYLRASLHRTRTKNTTLGQEVMLLQAYLAIQAIRMGERLHYQIDVPSEFHDITLPPLLIQPLVENAIKHGLESMIDGGVLVVQARRRKDSVIIEVIDTGQGLQAHSCTGVGLKNVRQRLSALYGERGNFNIKQNTPSGVKATLTLPLAITVKTGQVV